MVTYLLATLLTMQTVTIENDFLQVDVDPDRNTFTVRCQQTGKAFVNSGRFTHEIKSATKGRVSHPVWGKGQVIRIEHVGGWKTALRLFPKTPLLQLETTIHNGGEKPFVTDSEELVHLDVDMGLPPEQLKLFGTGFLRAIDDAPGSFSFAAVVDPATRRGVLAACLTHERSSGVFFTESVQGKVRLKARLDFGRFQVDPGEDRTTETLLVGYFDDMRLGLEAYADAVAKHYAIELAPQPGVYCTWYHGGASDEAKLAANARFSQEHLAPFGLSVLQIDDHWQKRIPEGVQFDGNERDLGDGGPIKVFREANDKFPRGMKHTADEITSRGLVPGIWFMPFAGNWKNPYFADKQDLFARLPDGSPFTTRWSGTILDMSNPKTQRFVHDRVKKIADWGYGYFKLDGMHTGAICHNVYVNTGYSTSGQWLNKTDLGGGVLHDPRMTHLEAYRVGLKVVREAAGPEVFILGCNVSQNMRSMGSSFGLIDAMRVGPDNGGAGSGRWSAVLVGARHGSNLYFLNRRIWHNDPDPVYVRPSNPIESARMMVSWVAVSGSMLTTSYQFADLPPERLDLLKRCMPSHRATARPVDLFESDLATIWLVTDTSRKPRRDVIGLFNWKEKEPYAVDYDMARLGLDAETTYVAFDYWADQFVAPIRGTLKQTLPPGTCRILAVRPEADHPQLLSTSRHITQGLVDVLEEHWNPTTRTLSGKSTVVAGDPYELRIALPTSSEWKATSATADGATIQLGQATTAGLRVSIESTKTHDVSWSVKF